MLEKTLESPLDSKDMKPVNPKENQLDIHWKDCCWGWNSNTFSTWCKELTHWKRLWCCERLRIEEGSRGWDGFMASLTQRTWVWANCGKQWRTEKPGVLQSMGSQTVVHNWVTEQQQPYKLKQNIVFSPAICFFISVADNTIRIAANYKK